MKLLVGLVLVLALAGCGGPLRHYEFANYGPGDLSAGDVTHASQSGAKVVTPKSKTDSPVAHYRQEGTIVLQDPAATPGKVRTSDAGEICDSKFRTGPYRLTTAAMKKHVCAAYGIKNCPAEGKMELDHLLPLELGGLDDERNLWVQPAPDFHWKDLLENALHAKVCKTHELQLAEAQACIITDWAKCYEKHIGPLPSK